MNPSPPTSAANPRRQRLGIAAALTLFATGWAAMQGDEPVSQSEPKKVRSTTVSTTPGSLAGNTAKRMTAWPDVPLDAPRAPWPAIGLLAEAAWRGPSVPKLMAPLAPAPAPKRVAAPTDTEAATPQAPNFPYVLIGRMDDGVPQAMLSGPTRSFGVRVNEVIDGQWRVDAVGPQSMSLTWLPGSIKKTVAFSAAGSVVLPVDSSAS